MRVAIPDVIETPDLIGRVHLVGIGGAGLSAIARLLAQQGVVVSGSDAQASPLLESLRAEGITCFVGHAAAQVADADTVIVSTAVREDNPEVVEARRRGLRLWPRSAGLRSAMSGHRTVAVAGTHGKTTTTAMLTCALQSAGAEPSFAIGAQVASLGTNAAIGTGELLVAEADESDGAFLVYSPDVAVVTNVDADHLDTWGSEEAYAEAFVEFVGTVGTLLVVNVDDPGAAALVPVARDRGLDVVTVGLTTPHADVRATDLVVDGTRTTFTAVEPSEQGQRVELAVPGAHYALDALLAWAVGRRLGHDSEALAAGLARYTGAQRRMERLGEERGVVVYDSYAHHPTEIRADLAAARAVAQGRRLVVAFQPHLVSRTRRHGAEMGQELAAADLVVLADLYLAREDPDPEVTSGLVLASVVGTPAEAGGPVDTLAEHLVPLLHEDDLLLTLGAGDITTVGPRVLELLRSGPA
ncbi:UDP-N-acetylmuramate--alanine ligase [Aeromicrobium sp. Root495]|uniref:UDP-N-acetylmuramate--L-alanine ligase n=1 Tax=Aeromicrobium sp. Root495 TaxID=1736550 RepID=UPI0006F35FBF|nr:UDP-N-acetylmuramate--L-alanine ligase [Aeromicrobium sp. Root495]KQY59030.1 UDP-N-acetylmuramate--alanine ligase [Aeromicrobium sp. Root495]